LASFDNRGCSFFVGFARFDFAEICLALAALTLERFTRAVFSSASCASFSVSNVGCFRLLTANFVFIRFTTASSLIF